MFTDEFQSLRVNCMTWTQYRDTLETNPIIFLPVGALEQHGPHLPMGCDAILADAMAVRTANALNGVVLPVLTYGYKSQARSGGGQLFPGTTSLDGNTLVCMLRDILREAFRHGAKKIVVLNGHVENQWFLTEGIDLALRDAAPLASGVRVVRCEYWNYTPQSVLNEIFDGPFPGVDLEHAALLETSMMLALHPALVRQEAFPPNELGQFPAHDSYPQNAKGVPGSGVLAPVATASAEKGKLLVDATVAAMVVGLKEAFVG